MKKQIAKAIDEEPEHPDVSDAGVEANSPDFNLES